MRKQDSIILVEGYMDVVSLYQAGVRNVSASLGTALTESQVKLIKRYTRNVILSYDADQAGRRQLCGALTYSMVRTVSPES